MKDSISKSRFGNPTSRQTVVQTRRTSDPLEDGPPLKRQKRESSLLSQNYAVPNTATSLRGHRTPQRANKQPVSRTKIPFGAELNVIDEDEDIGVHIVRAEQPTSSPDPLRLGTNFANSSVFAEEIRPSRPAVHAFDVDEQMAPGPSHIEDSETIQQLRQRNNDRKRKIEVNEVPDSETESIQEFDDIKADLSKRGQGSTQNVRNKITFFETREVEKLPRVDLAALNKPRQTKSVVGSMKPKNNASKQPDKNKWVKFNMVIPNPD